MAILYDNTLYGKQGCQLMYTSVWDWSVTLQLIYVMQMETVNMKCMAVIELSVFIYLSQDNA